MALAPTVSSVSNNITDVFISYARANRDFVRRLHHALEDHGRAAWVDWQDIPPTADWLNEIRRGIEAAGTFIFVLSPASALSSVCHEEVAHAVEHGKRLVPIVREDVDPSLIPPPLARLNWLFFRESDEFEGGVQTLVAALDTNLAWVKAHTRLLVRAIEWEAREADPSLLLRGADLRLAEQWLSRGTSQAPQSTPLQSRYVIASRNSETGRQRIVLISVTLGLVIALVLGGFGWYQRDRAIRQAEAAEAAQAIAEASQLEAEARQQEAIAAQARAEQQRRVAQSRQLAAQAQALFTDRLDLGLLLSVEAHRMGDTGEALASVLVGQRVRPELATVLRSSGDGVDRVAFSPDGRLMATGGEKGIVRLWNPATGQPVGPPLAGHTDRILTVAFSPDGRRVASGGNDQSVRVWDLATFQPAFSPLFGHTNGVNAVAFSPDGRLLVSASGDQTLRLWDAVDGHPVGSPLAGHTNMVESLAFRPDGKVIVSTGADGTMCFWSVETRSLLRRVTVGRRLWLFSVAYSPDGRHLATASEDGKIRIWDATVDPPVVRRTLDGGTFLLRVSFSPDSRLLASSDSDTVQLWDVATGKSARAPLTSLPPALTGDAGRIGSIAFSPDGRFFASGSERAVNLWDLKPTQQIERALVGPVPQIGSIAFSPDHGTLATGEDYKGVIHFWSVADGTPTESALLIGQPSDDDAGVTHLAFSPDGTLLAASTSDGALRVWNSTTRQLVHTLMTARDEVTPSLAFLPDGRLLVSGSTDGTIRVWDVMSGQQLGRPFNGDDTWVSSLAMSADGRRIASGSGSGAIYLWELVNGAPAETPSVRIGDTGHHSFVSSLAFSSDGNLLASGGEEGTIRLWSVSTGQPVGQPLVGHTDEVSGIAFGQNDRLLASGGHDGSVRLWDVLSGQLVGPPLASNVSVVEGIALSPHGLLTVLGGNRLRQWDLSVEAALTQACHRANRNLTREEWSRYLGDEPYQRTCPSLPDPRL